MNFNVFFAIILIVFYHVDCFQYDFSHDLNVRIYGNLNVGTDMIFNVGIHMIFDAGICMLFNVGIRMICNVGIYIMTTNVGI